MILVTPLLLLASTALAAPSLRTRQQSCPNTSDVSCKELVDRCAAQTDVWTGSNPYSNRVCVAAATCYGVGNLFSNAACVQNRASALDPKSVPGISSAVYANFVGTCTNCAITQQNYVDFVYGSIQSNWPSSVNTVTAWWSSIATWTAFPSGNVPLNNFNDWLHYSSAPNYVPPSSTTTPPSSTTAPPQPSSSNCPPPADLSCRDLVNGCVYGSSDWPSNPWSKKGCVAAATCYGVGNLFAYGRCSLGRSMLVPNQAPNLDATVYAGITGCTSGTSCGMTSQHYVDLVYSSITTGAWPPSPQYVIDSWWAPIASWAGFPSQTIPYNNFNDWLHWSSTEPSSPPQQSSTTPPPPASSSTPPPPASSSTTPPPSSSVSQPPTSTSTPLRGIQTTCKHDVSVSFDDGNYIWSDDIVDYFGASQSKTTFFVNGNNYDCIYNQGSVERLRRAYEAGHTIASHTWFHTDMTTITDAQLGAELDKLETALWKIVGIKPALIRPPYGSYNQRNLDYLNSRGYTVVTWDLDSGDSIGASVNDSMTTIRRDLAAHSMVLMHETIESTPEELVPQAVPYILSKNYKMVTVDKCLDIAPYQAVGQYGVRDSTWTC